MTGLTTSYPEGIASRRGLMRALAISAALAFILVTDVGHSVPAPGAFAPAVKAMPSLEMAGIEALTLGEQADILDRGADAAKRNGLIPVAGLSGGAVAPFRSIDPGSNAYAVALKCLTQAIYYEAANEPPGAQRAVAQVVLNRVRHPAFPDSVCGVVYEGWNRPFCQFTFVCDGSLLRQPLAGKWRDARQVAAEALSGSSEAAVGSATNYHADYVVPRWAYTLAKVGQLGTHIFYRLPGQAGSTAALTAHWDGREAIPQIDLQALRMRLDPAVETAKAVDVEQVPGLTIAPLASDRHAADDIGGRLDTTKAWRLTIPLPIDQRTESSPAAAKTVAFHGGDERGVPVS